MKEYFEYGVKRLFFLILGLVFSFQIFAQSITVKGVVKDSNGEAVIGANVVVVGTTNGTITDFDGKFTIKANKNAKLGSFVYWL
ncbi:carboxypeptidase-like regulatory domain-containing protein [Bacteroides thetaiotaomicron]|nr:carboxypeptidase-like regulatory domain-containing protein [Bacteroides thetaiotaomicron]